MTNKFYCETTTRYDKSISITDIKETNNMIFFVLNALSNKNGKITGLNPKIVEAIKNKTAFVDINGCGEKMRFLINALENAENRDIFMHSPLHSCVIDKYSYGYMTKDQSHEFWENYKPLPECEILLAKQDPFVAATICEKENGRTPIGLDFSVVIDTLIKKRPDGTFYLTDKIDKETKALLLEATAKQIKKIKSNERFKENFKRQDEKESFDDGNANE